MSQEFRTQIECPKCQHQQTMTLWKSLNAQVSPEALQDFRNGRINLFECRQCGFQGRVPVQFMFHDMQLKLAILLVPYETLEERDTLEMFNLDGSLRANLPPSQSDLFEQTGSGYITNPHIVLSMEEMLAYAYFRESLWRFYQGSNA